jgi:hypothetical protein
MASNNVELTVENLERSLRQLVETRSGFGDECKQERTLLDIFSEFDRDGSGYLDEDEFEAVMVSASHATCPHVQKLNSFVIYVVGQDLRSITAMRLFFNSQFRSFLRH